MSDQQAMAATVPGKAATRSDFLGHPRGLAILFATEAWERFSYFGNAALVVLYMVKYLLESGRVEAVLGCAAARAAMPFGLATYLRRQPARAPNTRTGVWPSPTRPLEAAEPRAVRAPVGICALVALFWAASDQQGSTIFLRAEHFAGRSF